MSAATGNVSPALDVLRAAPHQAYMLYRTSLLEFATATKSVKPLRQNEKYQIHDTR